MLNESNELVLVDFGLAKCFKEEDEDDIVKGNAGTIRFYAPEMVKTGVKNKVIHAKKTDIWAAGVFLYRLLTGGYPFAGDGVLDIKQQLLEDPVDYQKVEPAVASLLAKMLEKDPTKRATVEELIGDEWLTDNGANPIDLFVAVDTDEESNNSEKQETFVEQKKDQFSLESLSECSSEDSCSSSSEAEHTGSDEKK